MIPRSLIEVPQWCEACGASWSKLVMIEAHGSVDTVLEAECAEGHIVLCPARQVAPTPTVTLRMVPPSSDEAMRHSQGNTPT